MLQQTVQLATKIKEGNMSRHFQGLSRHRVQIQYYKTTRLCCDIENIYRDNNNMQLCRTLSRQKKIFVKPRENPNFLKNGKMVISVKIYNFSRSRMMKQTSPLESSREI